MFQNIFLREFSNEYQDINIFLLVVFVQIEFRVRDRLNGEKLVFVCKKKLVKFKCVKF